MRRTGYTEREKKGDKNMREKNREKKGQKIKIEKKNEKV